MNLPRGFRPHKPYALGSLKELTAYPYIVQPKLDGLRGIVIGGRLLSNSLKPFPNVRLNEAFKDFAKHAASGLFEGEFIIRGGTHQDVQSILMTEDAPISNVEYICFDWVINENNWSMPYRNRRAWLDSFIASPPYLLINTYMRPINTTAAYNLQILEELEKDYCELMGYEGIVIRSLTAPYKFGRATFKEGTFFKYKRTDDAEAKIIETLELEHNLNEQDTDERGYAKRSSHKANKHGAGIAGSLLVEGINGRYAGKTFRVSLGSATATQREWFWKTRKINEGRTITYTFAKYRGTDDAPAEPRWKCFRVD